jgi:predicted secreted hydrolase
VSKRSSGKSGPHVKLLKTGIWLAAIVLPTLLCQAVEGAPPQFSQVKPNTPLFFPQDTGAHPGFRTEWWYVTGWLDTPEHKPLGFQVTFFRSATTHDPSNPSRFAPKQLIIAHAALSDPTVGQLQHAQKSAREGFGLAYARVGNTDVKLDNWQLVRGADGRYAAQVEAPEYSLHLSLQPGQAMLLEGEQGFSQKGPHIEQASYYYSEPHLQVSGTLTRHGKAQTVGGTAWLDHEWSSQVLDAEASGWDWAGINLDDGASLMAFQIRNTRGGKLWAHASLRDASGKTTQFAEEQVKFTPLRGWRSPRTNAVYPVATSILIGSTNWELIPLQDDQELDSRLSTGAVYWEGAVKALREGKDAGRGYLELTGYVDRLKL